MKKCIFSELKIFSIKIIDFYTALIYICLPFLSIDDAQQNLVMNLSKKRIESIM